MVVVAWLSLGAAVFALGWTLRAVGLVGALPVVGGFIVWVLADTVNWPEWVAWLSPFTHLASVPAEGPDWVAEAGMVCVAALLTSVGLVGSRVGTYADEPAEQRPPLASRDTEADDGIG